MIQCVINDPERFYNRDILKVMNHTEFDLLSSIIIKGTVGDSNRITSMSHHFSIESKFKSINSKLKAMGDYKTQLWLPLPLEDKLSLYLAQNDLFEATLMGHMIFKEYYQSLGDSNVRITGPTTSEQKRKGFSIPYFNLINILPNYILFGIVYEIDEKLDATANNLVQEKYISV